VNWPQHTKRVRSGRATLELNTAPTPIIPAPAVDALGVRPLQRVGNTPLLRFESLARGMRHVQVLGKAEWVNPGGSVKDRAALNIIENALRSGALSAGKRLLDATSGNTGIAYAMIGAAHGVPVTLCVPANVSAERKRILAAYGAEIIWTDPQEGTDGAIRLARKMHQAEPDKYFYADQYSNDANWKAHYCYTASEIWQQTQGRVTHFVSMLGTSGTFMGVTRRLKELNPAVQCISLQPDSPLHGLEGLKHMETAMVPGIYDPAIADGQVEVATEDAHQMVLRLAREEGYLVGVSSGANLVGAMKVASELKDGVVVTIFCDSAAKYLSESFWQDVTSEAENWP